MQTEYTHHPHAAGGEHLALEAHAIVRTGKALLSCGAETYRVRQSMGEVAVAIGIEWLQSHVTLSELTVTLFKGATFRTQVGNVHSVGVNADKMSELEEMTSQLTPGTTPAEVERHLDAIDAKEKLYAPWLQALMAAIACVAVAFLNNMWALGLIGVFAGSFLGQFLRAWFSRWHINVYVTTLAAALVAALCYMGVMSGITAATHSPTLYSAGLVAALIFIVPGFPLVNSLLDLVKTDTTAGLSRLAYAFMILASAAVALLVVTWIWRVDPEPLPGVGLPRWLWWVLALAASGIGVAGWAVMFNVGRRGALLAGVCGLVGNGVRLLLIDWRTPEWLAAAAACLIIGVLAAVLANASKLASVTLVVPAALIMAPGAPAFRALVYFSRGDTMSMMTNASLAVFTIVGMAIGLSLARILFDRNWILDKRLSLGS